MSRSFFDKGSTSYLHTRALEALSSVLNEHGTDAVERIFAEVIWKQRESELWTTSRKKRETDHVCAKRLYTKMCGIPGCLGAHEQLNHAMDHANEWHDENNQTVRVSSEPYAIDLDGLRSIVHFCDDHKLDATISGDSSWFPGKTILIAIDRR